MATIIEDIHGRIQEGREKLKTRIEEWKERGWRGSTSSNPNRFPIVKEIREKGLASTMRARREKRIGRRRGEVGPARKPGEIAPAFPKDMLVKKEREIAPTVGKRKIAIEL